jgi:hypothetical protein
MLQTTLFLLLLIGSVSSHEEQVSRVPQFDERIVVFRFVSCLHVSDRVYRKNRISYLVTILQYY